MSKNNRILADGRWFGPYGIGRFSTEILLRLNQVDVFTHGPKALSLNNLIWLPYFLHKNKSHYKALFIPSFNPVIHSPIPFVFTICDLIHLHIPGKAKFAKKAYYDLLIKPTAQRAFKVITISEYSKKTIVEWANIPEENVVVVHCGVSETLNSQGERYHPGYPYLLHVGNTKPHKNVTRLLQAFATAKIDRGIRLILTGKMTLELSTIIKTYHLENRVIFSGTLTETQLAEYYRGAIAVVFPSLYEGFGLPVLEAMACGVPALTADTTSLPEIAGDAAIIVNPYERDAIKDGIEQIVNNNELRHNLITKGFLRTQLYSWDKTAAIVQSVLNTI